MFCYITGTGRTATHWVQSIIDALCNGVATFHDGFLRRAKIRSTKGAFWRNYLLNLEARSKGAGTYVECNPALLEHVALTYGITSAPGVLPSDVQAHGLLITRHPYTYAASLKAKGWGWAWWNYPKARDVFNIGTDFANRSMVEQAAIAWSCKNAFAHGLLKGDCLWLKYEFLFDYRVSQARYLERVHSIFEQFKIEPQRGDNLIWQMRNNQSAVKNKDKISLTAAEKQMVKAICGPVMELYEYV